MEKRAAYPHQEFPGVTPPPPSLEGSILAMYGKHRGKLTLSPFQSNPISCNTLTGSSGIIWNSSSFLSSLPQRKKRLHNAIIKTTNLKVTTRQSSSKSSFNSALAISEIDTKEPSHCDTFFLKYFPSTSERVLLNDLSS